MEEFSFLLKVEGKIRRLCSEVGRSSTRLFSAHALFHSSIFSIGKWDKQDFLPLPREKGGLFLPTEVDEAVLFLVKLDGPVCFLRWSSLLSDYMGGNSLLEDGVENLYMAFDD